MFSACAFVYFCADLGILHWRRFIFSAAGRGARAWKVVGFRIAVPGCRRGTTAPEGGIAKLLLRLQLFGFGNLKF